jgi:hypothetical protein
MKKVCLAVLLSLLVASAASADHGIILLINPIDPANPNGSMYGEAVEAGVSTVPETWPWGTTHNPNAKVNIELEDPVGNFLYSDFRLIGQHNVEQFDGRIWTTDPNQAFDITSGFISSIHGGPWVVPDYAVIIDLWQGGEFKTATIARRDIGDWSKYFTGLKGDWNFQINLYQSVVPEPGSFVALGSGLVGLIGFSLRRRR